MIQFSKLDPALEAEGITLELLHEVQHVHGNLPVLLEINHKIQQAIPIKCTGGYWLAFNDAYVMENNKLKVFPLEQIILGRARYWKLNGDAEMEERIEKEIAAIKATLIKEATKIVENFDMIYHKAYGEWKFRENKPKGGGIDVMAILSERYKEELGEDAAKAFAASKLEANPDYEVSVTGIKELLDAEDYDGLYMTLKTDGLPLIMSVSKADKDSMAVMVQMFHVDKLEGTIEEMKGKSHLYMVCKAKVLQKMKSAA